MAQVVEDRPASNDTGAKSRWPTGTAGASDTPSFHSVSRKLHWFMAIGFLLMWLSGVLVTNVEGVPYFVENDLQGVIRDLHKSIGLTLIGLLVVRAALRFIYPAPALPTVFSQRERKLAHTGHVALYVVIAVTCVTGYAIADLQDYGNAYFGLDLPALFPVQESVAGWAVAPWSYVLHALFAYGLLAMVIGHMVFVIIHTKSHRIDLLARMLKNQSVESKKLLKRLVMGVVVAALAIVGFAVRGFATLGPAEEPRDYISTTPFGR